MDAKDEGDSQEKESDNNLQEKFNDMTDSDAKTLLNKKTKPVGNNDDLLKQELPPNKNKQKKLENPPKKIQEFQYGYIIHFLEDEENGLIEDFLPKNIDSSDFYNYGLTPEIFEKRLHDSLLHHYENHLIEEKEKRDKMNMFMFNMNINMNMNNMGNNFIQRGMGLHPNQMSNFMMNNMNYNGNNIDNTNINRNYIENRHQMINEENK